MAAADPNGLVVVDKPSGWTSHDVVAKSRGILGTRKVGHSGTLDPMATGVLVLGVGRATRLLNFLTGLPKAYEAEIRFGAETDSLDADGEVTREHPDMAAPTAEQVRAAAATLTGAIEQVPPMVSAIKVDGRRLHQLAREGREVERAPRPVTVTRFDLVPTGDPMVWNATIDCSSGTYVRVLAADLGHALGGGAHLIALRRTAVGPFTLAEAQPFGGEVPGQLMVMPPSEITRVLAPVRLVDPDLVTAVGHGKVLARDAVEAGSSTTLEGAGPWAVLSPSGDLLAVYTTHKGDTLKPALVLPS